MYKRIHGRLLFYALTLSGLFIAGLMILASFLSHPGSGRGQDGRLFMVVFLSFPGIMGLVALGLRRGLGFPWWLGASLLAYPLVTFLTLSPEARQYLTDGLMGGRLAYSDASQFTGLHLLLLLLTIASVVGSLFFLGDLKPAGQDP